MFTDSIRTMLCERRREIAATRERKHFEDMIDRADAAMLELDANETATNERALASVLDSIKAYVLTRLVENNGNTSALPFLSQTLADGRTVRELCIDEIAAVEDVRMQNQDVQNIERYVAGDRDRIEEARTLYIKPLEDQLTADIAAVDAAKKSAEEAERRLNTLKHKYRIA